MAKFMPNESGLFSLCRFAPVLRENIHHLCALDPECEHRFCGDQDIEAFIRSAYGGSMLGVCHFLPPCNGASRLDLFRYLYL